MTRENPDSYRISHISKCHPTGLIARHCNIADLRFAHSRLVMSINFHIIMSRMISLSIKLEIKQYDEAEKKMQSRLQMEKTACENNLSIKLKRDR